MLEYTSNNAGTYTLRVDGEEWTVPAGILKPDLAEVVISDLSRNWRDIGGGQETAMRGEKVFRAEGLRFENGYLRFDIERHAGTINGSTRADLHTWEINPNGRGCGIVKKTRRQLSKQAAPYRKKDARKDAFAVLRVLTGRRKNRGEMEDIGDGEVVIYAGRFANLGRYEQTRIGRLQRFVDELEDVVKTRGWSVIKANPRESSRITLRRDDS